MRLIFYIALLSCVSLQLSAQHNDVQSLYMYDALTINPAYAGNKGALTFNANYRDQWRGVSGSPKTISLSSHLLSKSKKTGLGMTILNDKFGIQNDLRIKGIYAYKVKWKQSTLSLGAAAGIRNQSIDFNALNLGQADDISFLNQSQRGTYFDFSFGAMYKYKTLLVGLTLPNMYRSNDQQSSQALNGYASYIFDLGHQFKLKPTTLIKYVTGSPLNVEGNATFYYQEAISFGFGLKNSKAGNIYAQLQLNRQFSVAYLFERHIGSNGQIWQNTHEVMLNYTLDYKTNVQSPRYL